MWKGRPLARGGAHALQECWPWVVHPRAAPAQSSMCPYQQPVPSVVLEPRQVSITGSFRQSFSFACPRVPQGADIWKVPSMPSNAQLPYTAEKHLAGLAPKLGKNSVPSCERAPRHLSRWRPALSAKRPLTDMKGGCQGQDSQLGGSQGRVPRP